ncbi:MAG: hypothetical protein PHV82_06080 [Victivallaceae bacterium]|nr:hypothetical protein [Victivallaceae bacterium]
MGDISIKISGKSLFMDMNVNISIWDISLIIAVSAMGAILAFLKKPEHKALIWNFPVPFTLACLALGKPINETHVLGLVLLTVYTFAVYCLHVFYRMNIVLSIVISVILYCVLAGIVKQCPQNNYLFWSLCFLLAVFAAMLLALIPDKPEPESRTQLPVLIKLPMLVGIATFMVVLKTSFEGAITTFPMVGVIAGYEARKCLWTVCRQVPVMILSLLSMIITCRIMAPCCGEKIALLIAWGVFLTELPLLLRVKKQLTVKRTMNNVQ